MKKTEKIAQEFTRKVRNITFNECTQYMILYKCRVIYYNTQQGDTILSIIGALDYARTVPALSCKCDGGYIIAIDNNVAEPLRLTYLLHEIGHILLGHIDNGFTYSMPQECECEANKFVESILYPPSPLVLLKRWGAVVCCIIFAVICTLFFSTVNLSNPTTLRIEKENVPSVQSPSVDSLQNTSEELVCVTAGGEKYHRQSCIHAKSNAIILTKEAAIKKGYGACNVCNP